MKSIVSISTVVLIPILVAFILSSCATDSPPWPSDYSEIFTKVYTDPENDLDIGVPGSPPYDLYYAPCDVTQVLLGVEGDYLYIRVDYAANIPLWPVFIPEDPPVEAQIVGNHGTGIYLDIDSNDMTGFLGCDVSFGVGFEYGTRVLVGAQYDYSTIDEPAKSQIEGELGEGGPGYKYSIGRINISGLGELFPKGTTVEIDVWAESMSFDFNGNEFYHHFAFDTVAYLETWTLP